MTSGKNIKVLGKKNGSNSGEKMDSRLKEPTPQCQSEQKLKGGAHAGWGDHLQNSTVSSNSHLETGHAVV